MSFANLPIILGIILILIGVLNPFEIFPPLYIGFIWALTVITLIFTLIDLIKELIPRKMNYIYIIQDVSILIALVISLTLSDPLLTHTESFTFIIFGLVLMQNGFRNNRAQKAQINNSGIDKSKALISGKDFKDLEYELAIIENNSVEELNSTINQLKEFDVYASQMNKVHDGWTHLHDSFNHNASPYFISYHIKENFNEFLISIGEAAEIFVNLSSVDYPVIKLGDVTMFSNIPLKVNAYSTHSSFETSDEICKQLNEANAHIKRAVEVWAEIFVLSRNNQDTAKRRRKSFI